MNENSLSTKDGVVLIKIMQRKAAQLNQLFGTSEWTPRKIDMVLWTYGRQSVPPKENAPASQKTKSPRRREERINQRNRDHDLPLSNHEMIASALETFHGKVLTTSEIKKIVISAFPHFSEGRMLPNDHGFGNKSPCRCAGTVKRIFDRIEAGKYLVL
ncbi:MAG: hypothetical protein IPO38_01260 [Rhodocyclaceae bacterium]|nr:hypothetical protein [Rhodocyclaceae bacterium]